MRLVAAAELAAASRKFNATRASPFAYFAIPASAFEDVHFGSRQQRGVHLERRVFRRRTDENDVAGFDAGEKGVLLRLVETVDLVDEHKRAAAAPACRFRFRHDLADFLDARQNGAERDEPRARRGRDHARQRGLTGAWRTPQDDRLQPILLDGRPQRTSRTNQCLLADELVERPRPHPLGKRRR